MNVLPVNALVAPYLQLLARLKKRSGCIDELMEILQGLIDAGKVQTMEQVRVCKETLDSFSGQLDALHAKYDELVDVVNVNEVEGCPQTPLHHLAGYGKMVANVKVL